MTSGDLRKPHHVTARRSYFIPVLSHTFSSTRSIALSAIVWSLLELRRRLAPVIRHIHGLGRCLILLFRVLLLLLLFHPILFLGLAPATYENLLVHSSGAVINRCVLPTK